MVQTGSQRTRGVELEAVGSVTSAWEVAAGYANQDAFITSRTSAAPAGARVALVPRHTLSLWNRYQVTPRWGAGVGVIHRSDMYAAVDNTVTLPGYVDVDGALYVTLTRSLHAQANVENLFDATYYATANGNNNISPGSRRAIRVSLVSGF
jgi:catecholate siderophore receptor